MNHYLIIGMNDDASISAEGNEGIMNHYLIIGMNDDASISAIIAMTLTWC